MNGSFDTARIAGTESTAKITSVISITTSAASSGVAARLRVDAGEELLPVELVADRHDPAQQPEAAVVALARPRRRGGG